MILRANQIAPVELGKEYFKSGTEPSIIVAPTAFGKSLVIAHIANSLSDPTLVLQPSKELLEQNFNKFTALGGQAKIYSASMKSKEIGHITYATVGSIKDLGRVFKDSGFRQLIVDECHLFPREKRSMFGALRTQMKATKVLGLTATPFRHQNNMSLTGIPYSRLVILTTRNKFGTFFKDFLNVTQISQMVKEKFWSPLEYQEFDFSPKSLVFNSQMSEYTADSIAKAYEDQLVGEKIARFLETSPTKCNLVFVPTIAAAQEMEKLIPDSRAIWGDMDKKERAKIIAEFNSSNLRTVINVNVLSVGYDNPLIDCIVY